MEEKVREGNGRGRVSRMEKAWERLYLEKKITAAQAAGMVKSGDSICAVTREPKTILRELGKRKDIHGIIYYCSQSNFLGELSGLGGRAQIFLSFMDDTNRSFAESGAAQFIPCNFSGYGKLSVKELKCRIAMPCVTKPDKDGYVSMGNAADGMPDILKQAELVIGEINPELPFVYGENVRHISEFDYIVEGDGYPLNLREIDDTEEKREIYRAIGAELSELVEDEATLEVGLGRLNSSAMMYMDPKRDLGVHTEIYGDLFMELTKRGMVTNRKKTVRPGVSVCAQIVGSRELFDFVEKNQGIEMDGCHFVLNPGEIAKNRKMTAINNAVQVDLLGQANAEYLKGKQYSGMGGIADFSAGASLCPDGKSIVVLESVTGNGKYSKIVPAFEPGTPVSLTRTMVEYVVTEYGTARLAGRTVKERARELIRIAHPKFREELAWKAEKMGLI